MFIKLTRSKGHSYAQLVESFRDANGRPRQRNLVTLGRVDEYGGPVDKVLRSLLKARGLDAAVAQSPQVRFESALALGDVWALDQLWRQLGFDALAGVFRRARYTAAVEQAIRVMVFNRLCDADSKLGALRWLHAVSMPGVDASKVTYQQLLRSMDALMDHQSAVDDTVAQLLRPLIDAELSMVFYDLTTMRTEGLSQQAGDVRQYGMSKEGLVARQFMLGVVQTADGLPIYHEVFDGNTAEVRTLEPTLQKVLSRHPHIQRLIVVADRGLLSTDNIEQLSQLRVGHSKPLEFILAVPGRRYSEFVDLLQPLQAQAQDSHGQSILETQWQGHRLVMAHHSASAEEQSQQRLARITELEKRAAQLSGKRDSQDGGVIGRGRKLSDSGAKARFYHEVCEAHLANIIKVDLKSKLFSYKLDEQALARAQMMDGKLLLITNVNDLDGAEMVRRYKSLADIERGFRVLKSEIEIAPLYHRLPERIRAHASICFIALVLHRVMRQRLKSASHAASPETALKQLRSIQRHRISINEGQPITGITAIHQEHADLLQALNLKRP